MADRLPFWSDDFDMDLLKVFTDVTQMLRDPDRVLWTLCGRLTHGRINCPAMWNGVGSILFFNKPNLSRDEHGWFNLGGLVSDDQEAECTWLEWLRDMWSHSHTTMFWPSRQAMPDADFNGTFYPIMADLRGWRKQDISEHWKRALHWVMRCDSILRSLTGTDENKSCKTIDSAKARR